MQGLALLALCAAACDGGVARGGADLAVAGGICPGHSEHCGGACCGSACTDLQFDRANCGACATACPAGLVCASGSCSCPQPGGGASSCGLGQSCCGLAGCKSLMSDRYHCGACANDCTQHGGDTCQGGQCSCAGAPACTGGQSCCAGRCASSCGPADLGSGADGGLSCHCAKSCLSGLCVGPDCCWEQSFLGICSASTSCQPGPG